MFQVLIFSSETSSAATDPLLQLVSLQEASGCWPLSPALAAALGKSSEEVTKSKPASVRRQIFESQHSKTNLEFSSVFAFTLLKQSKKEVWATILVLVWLHGLRSDAKVEWELLAMKATSWICGKRGKKHNDASRLFLATCLFDEHMRLLLLLS